LSQSPDHSDQPSTLSGPELNPLLNPLLSQNMGRWAEAYFRNPPETREQAILELLEQLEAEKSREENEGAISAVPAQETRTPSSDPTPRTIPLAATSIQCEACGTQNPGDQRFCGACGAPLTTVPASVVRSEFTSDRFITVAEDPYASVDTYRSSQERNSFHDQEFLSFAEPPRSSRGYVIAGVLLVVLAVGYVAWKGGSSYFPQNKGLAAPDTQQSAAGAVPTPQLTHPDIEPIESSTPAPSVRNGIPPKAAPDKEPAPTPLHEKAEQPVRPAAIVSKQRPPALVNGGAEELSVAQSYLDGTGGHERNSAEAVDWLWKSVGKRNATATLVLADLYLRGDRIPKNCDQARVLLDAAASRCVQGATMRLRNMQAFGCQ